VTRVARKRDGGSGANTASCQTTPVKLAVGARFVGLDCARTILERISVSLARPNRPRCRISIGVVRANAGVAGPSTAGIRRRRCCFTKLYMAEKRQQSSCPTSGRGQEKPSKP